MCGIFGFISKTQDSGNFAEKAAKSLFLLSESRGKEAAGFAALKNSKLHLLKAPEPASVLVKRNTFRDILKEGEISLFIGHTRLVTNGSLEKNENNQPVIRDGTVGVHNGIIVNEKEMWAASGLSPKTEVDTEAYLALVQHLKGNGLSALESTRQAMKNARGTVSIAILFENNPELVLATNNGSLYIVETAKHTFFASERHILNQFISFNFESDFGEIQQINPGEVRSFRVPFFRGIVDHSSFTLVYQNNKPSMDFSKFEKVYLKNKKAVDVMRRCTRCILPESMPFIEFNTEGVCNYCRDYKNPLVKGQGALDAFLDQFRKKGRDQDCLLPLSGGRDSSFALHLAVKEMGLKPLAFSYDWGMVTDLARRNQARLCGELGVEHIFVSADIKRKRENIKKNVSAWLRKPDLGLVPLFMAGDKQYFYYINKLREQNGLRLAIYSENPHEKTNFKYGFAGIKTRLNVNHGYNQGLLNSLRLMTYYGRHFLTNPSYLNRSILDTGAAFLSSYAIPHDYLFLFQYIPWNEIEVDQTLRKYDWEMAPDTDTTWRIGDGTAPFYNYIYYTVAGLTENDTFRSNQIRSGTLTREEALEKTLHENEPRFPSIQWYCDTIGIDAESTLEIINKIPKIYEQ